jgi:DNA sulfur modification protein DndD
MILERLVLENFRQFKGRQELIFSDIKHRNVTLVHAENGFGKTTLLKALHWGLYGRSGLMGTDGKPDDFEKPDRIIHEGLAYREKEPENLSAKVQITFKHNNDRYILTRSLSLAQQKLCAKKTNIILEVMRDGQTIKLERPQQIINAIVPDGIRKFLFFNGERINYLAMEENSNQVTEAIHQMLGLKLLQTTIDDLKHPSVRGRLRNEQKDATCKEKRDLIEKLCEIENKISEYDETRKQIIKNIDALRDEIETVENKLAANREASELQRKRIKLKKEIDRYIQKRNNVSQELAKIIAYDGYSLFTDKLIQKSNELIGRLRSEGKIPARVMNSFLQELIESGKCICGRCLREGSSERASVEQLLTIAGDNDFNNAVSAIDHALGHISAVSKPTEKRLTQLNAKRLEFQREIRNRDEELEEIHQLLGNKKDEEVQSLEEKRKKLEIDIELNISKKGEFEEKIFAANKQKSNIELQIRQIKDKEESAARAQRRVNAVDDCIKILSDILRAETEDLRPLLNNEIDTHFRKIMTKDYWAELTENYTLRIRKSVAGNGENQKPVKIDAALSTGERTVTSLVFIASLLSLAQKRAEIPTILDGLTGASYPVAIDSPFGSLSIFRHGIARYIPELAPQVILFVSLDFQG